MPKPPAQDTLNKRQLALQYGFALSVLKSDPELWHLFNQMTKNNWTQDKFNAELLNTKWFQKTSAAQRQAMSLRATDPATWKARVNQTRALIRDAAVNMGAQVSDDQITALSKNVLRFGWNDAQIRDTLAGAIKMGTKGTYGGQAEANAEQLREIANRNGIKLGDTTLRGWLVRLGAGESMDGFNAYVRQMASSAFPQFADKLQAGHDLADIAEPYRQQMAQTLEIDPESIDMFDPTIRKALNGVDAEGKPTTKPLWAFEQELKKDSRWRTTNNARDELMNAGRQVLQDFGLAS